MIAGIDPRVDYAFKKVFGSEANVPILVDLLHAVLKPARRIVELELLNPFNDKDAADDKLSVLDIKARDEEGQRYNVEMQIFASRVHLDRVLYYWAVLHGEQLREGDDYTKVCATISIAIVNSVLFPDVPDYHLEFRLRDTRYPQLDFSSKQVIHLLELPKFEKSADDLADPLEVWCFFLKHAAELDAEQMPATMKAPMVQKAMEVLSMLSQSDIERERYRARLKWELDRNTFIVEARQEGLAEGRAEGRTEGRTEGRAEGRAEGEEKGQWLGRIRVCEELLGLPVSEKATLDALSLQELQARAQGLQQQVRAR